MVEEKKSIISRTLLVDMDCITVSMLSPWLKRYNEVCGTNVKVDDIKEYNVGKVCTNERILYDILDEDGFFYNMDPMPGAVESLQSLMNDGYNVMFVTQPPRAAELAVRDKRNWIQKYFPSYDLRNMIFCHHKEFIRGDLIFDDKESHLVEWKKINPSGIAATLDWQFTRTPEINRVVNFRGSLDRGWYGFVKFVRDVLPLKC